MPSRSLVKKTARMRRERLRIERLEDRCVMDGAGFVHTDPPEDPDSIVGVAGIIATDDYESVRINAQSVRIAPLANDLLPEGSTNLSIKSVSATARGASVSISEDGKHLIYDAGPEGFQYGDSFYYIVQTDDGKLGKANVTLTPMSKPWSSGEEGGGYSWKFDDRYEVIEDGPEQRLNLLNNDYLLRTPVIVAVSAPTAGGAVKISDDGQSVWYRPAAGYSGGESFQYTARGADGSEVISNVWIRVIKPYQIKTLHDDAFIDAGTGSQVLDPLSNDIASSGPTRIASFSAPDYVGHLTLLQDGKQFAYDPAVGFYGEFTISYTVRYGDAEHQTIDGSYRVRVSPQFLAVENWFEVDPASAGSTRLDVLTNDPLLSPFAYTWGESHYRETTREVSLRVVAVSGGSEGGAISISADGKGVLYQPADGFIGEETFTYTVEASNGVRESASVTVRVADRVAGPSGVDRFASEGAFKQFIIDQAVARYAKQFGQYSERYANYGGLHLYPYESDIVLRNAVAFDSVSTTQSLSDHSETNVQVAGVDEADIVETDGRYVYTITDGQLAIVDMDDPTAPRLLSLTGMPGGFQQMYLQGDRLTLLRTGDWSSNAEVVVLDIADRADPKVVERTEIDGYISDSRAIGDKVHLVVKQSFVLPALEGEWVIEPIPPEQETAPAALSHDAARAQDAAYLLDHRYLTVANGTPGVYRNESLSEYLDRVRDKLTETSLPGFRTYGADGGLVASGLLTDPSEVHKPLAGADLLVSVLTLDAGDDTPGPIAPATSFVADANTNVYVSADSTYVFTYNRTADATTVYKLNFDDDGGAPIVATGVFAGRMLNQFSADEHNGRLRVATTQTVTEEVQTSWGTLRRQARQFNNLFVLEQTGAELTVVGEVTNLAPTETIKSVRFMGDRAYVVTFRVVDPLFAIDLSDPTQPVVQGALKIPGYSDYLHPVGQDYLIGIGRDADEITGRLGAFQVTLFNVSDLANPVVADQLTFEGDHWASSEAWFDHHAVAYFAESGVLALPINWSEQVATEGGGYSYESLSAIWTFKVTTGGEDASIEATGSIEHGPASSPYHLVLPIGVQVISFNPSGVAQQSASPARRALRIGETLITVSNHFVKAYDLNDPTVELGEAYIGPPARDDSFSIVEDSGANTLKVLENDYPGFEGQVLSIAAVSQPAQGGVVTISADGRSLVFTPDADFAGQAVFTYTVIDALRGEQTAGVWVNVENTPDAPIAVDDTFSVESGSGGALLEPRLNDVNVDPAPPSWGYSAIDVITLSISDVCYCGRWPTSINGLTITEIGPTDQGGTVELTYAGGLVYTPASGFEGVESFTYTVTNSSGLSSTATVYVTVGLPPAVDWASAAVVMGPEFDPAPQFFLASQHAQATTPRGALFAENPAAASRRAAFLDAALAQSTTALGAGAHDSAFALTQRDLDHPTSEGEQELWSASDRVFASLGADFKLLSQTAE